MKISELSLAGAIAGTEVFPIVQGGTTKKVSIADALAGAGGGTSTGVNGLNGTTNIGLGGTLLNDTIIDGDTGGYNLTFEFINKYKIDCTSTEIWYGGIQKVFSASDPLIILGYHDISNSVTIGLKVDLNGEIKTQLQGVDFGLKLDYINNAYFLGAVDGAGSTIVVDNFNGNVYIENSINQSVGFYFDLTSQIYQFGDLPNNNKLTIDSNGEIKFDVTRSLTSYFENIINGIKLDYQNSYYSFGSIDKGNKTTLFISDNDNVSYFINTANNPNIDAQGFYLEFLTGRYVFGDVSRNLSGQTLEINSNDGSTYFKSGSDQNGLALNFADDNYYFGNLISLTSYINVNASSNKIFFVSTDGLYNIANIPSYTDNAQALSAGLVVGDLYRHNGSSESADQLRIVH